MPGLGDAAGPGPHGRWFVLLDAAKATACQPPDLTAAPADFVVRCCLGTLGLGYKGCLFGRRACGLCCALLSWISRV